MGDGADLLAAHARTMVRESILWQGLGEYVRHLVVGGDLKNLDEIFPYMLTKLMV